MRDIFGVSDSDRFALFKSELEHELQLLERAEQLRQLVRLKTAQKSHWAGSGRPYSEHSSFNELVEYVRFLRPHKVRALMGCPHGIRCPPLALASLSLCLWWTPGGLWGLLLP